MNTKNTVHTWLLNVTTLVAGATLLATVAGASPVYLAKLQNGGVDATYQLPKVAVLSLDNNVQLITKVLAQLPMAKSVSLLSSSTPIIASENSYPADGYKDREYRQVHLFAVSFEREDYLPRLHFQVKQTWHNCEPTNDVCKENVAFEIVGPTKAVRLLSDFSRFPKALNSFKLTLQVANLVKPTDGFPATATWNFAVNPDNGFEEYLRYFREKFKGSMQDDVTTTTVNSAVGLWIKQVSEKLY